MLSNLAYENYGLDVFSNTCLPSLEDTDNGFLYPNPILGEFNYIVFQKEATSARLRVFSINGALIKDQDVELNKGYNKLLISDLNVQSGVYFIEILSSLGREVNRFIVE